MNNSNEHAVIKTNLKDVLVNAANICDCDFKIYLNEQTSQVPKTLEAKRKIEAKFSSTWYPLAREDITQPVYQVEFQKEMRIKIYEGTRNLSNEESNANRILEDERRLASMMPNPIELPNDPSLHSYFATICKEGKRSIYGNINKKGSKEKNRKKDDGPKQTQLDAVAYRLIYRFLLHLKELWLIVQMPDACKEWIDISNNETSMYGEMSNLTPYEREGLTFVLKESSIIIGESSQGDITIEKDASRKGKRLIRESIGKVKHTTNLERGQSQGA
ncbi:hypothetical protein L7F22_014599 [Adiantum nelumboides]|nr:hypothetical protein [Adiantum nelumboides]